MTGHARAFVAAFALLALMVSRPAVAGPATDQLTQGIDRVVKTLQDGALRTSARSQERRQALRAISDDIFDWAEMAKRSLGRHWEGRTEAERAEFSRLLGDLIERSYMTSIERFGGEKITFLGESPDGDRTTVSTRILTSRGQNIAVQYRMILGGERWRVYDVVIEGVSLVGNYRTQFDKVIQTSSYQELVKKLAAQQLVKRASLTE